jgi:hypothetical protein
MSATMANTMANTMAKERGNAMRTIRMGWLLLMAVLVGACATASGKGNKLEETQYAYSAAIRWGDFEGAWNLVDPKYRDAHPMTDLQFERYKQIQVSGYRDLGTQTLADGSVVREVEVGVVNRNNMTERSLRYTEHWRYDEATKAWLLDNGLPDFWNGE